jgi:hypothetical protein
MSVHSSEITGVNYHNGIRDGFMKRNATCAVLLSENTIHWNETTGASLGDVDMVFQLKENKPLTSLFPLTDAFVQHQKSIDTDKKLFLEVTALTGENLLRTENNKSSSKLKKKVDFYNHLHDRKIVGEEDLVAFVYNGEDPTEVKRLFDDLNPQFRGAVIHFNRQAVSTWKNQEELLESQEELLKKDEELLKINEELLKAEAKIAELERKLKEAYERKRDS